MCNVMCQWLEIADVRISSSGRPSGTTGFAGAAGYGAADGAVPDEFTLLSVSWVLQPPQHYACRTPFKQQQRAPAARG